nr:hypothetical protein [Tanacetum cinerariifolium]
MLPIKLTNADIRNSEAYKEYYAVATGATPPKTKASIRKTKSSSDTTVTPPSTAAAGTRLFTFAKGKQPATTSKAKILTTLSEVAKQVVLVQMKELVLYQRFSMYPLTSLMKKSLGNPVMKNVMMMMMMMKEMMVMMVMVKKNLRTNVGRDEGYNEDDEEDKLYKDININLGRGEEFVYQVEHKDTKESNEMYYPKFTKEDKGDDDEDDQEDESDDEQASDKEDEEFIYPSLSTHDEEETRDEESFDPIPKTLENTDDEGRGVQMADVHTAQESEDSYATLIPVNPDGQLQSSSKMTSFSRLLMNMQKIIKEQVKEQVKVQVTKMLPKIKQTVNEQLEAEVLTQSSNSSKTSYAVVVDLSEMELKKILIEKMESNKSIHRSNEQRNLYKALVEKYESDKIILDTYEDTVTLKRRRDGKELESASAPKEKATRSAGKSTQGSKSRQTSASESATAEEPMLTTHEMEEPLHLEFETGADDQPIIKPSQHPECELAKQSDSRSSFNELMDTPVDLSDFLMNRLKVDTMTPELLDGPTYELMKGSCKSLVELEFFLEEVYKATTYQLDWVNPEGQQYPHNQLKPLPLIPNSRGRHVIPFDHFINNDLEYLRGGSSSRKYTTSVTKTKATDYGHIKWIEDLVPRKMWIQGPVGYDKYALWGISHWGRKHQQFYSFAVNRESVRDVYSKRRIIAVTELKIIEWHNYKHLDWIMVHRDDDKFYKFKEGDFKRLRI